MSAADKKIAFFFKPRLNLKAPTASVESSSPQSEKKKSGRVSNKKVKSSAAGVQDDASANKITHPNEEILSNDTQSVDNSEIDAYDIDAAVGTYIPSATTTNNNNVVEVDDVFLMDTNETSPTLVSGFPIPVRLEDDDSKASSSQIQSPYTAVTGSRPQREAKKQVSVILGQLTRKTRSRPPSETQQQLVKQNLSASEQFSNGDDQSSTTNNNDYAFDEEEHQQPPILPQSTEKVGIKLKFNLRSQSVRDANEVDDSEYVNPVEEDYSNGSSDDRLKIVELPSTEHEESMDEQEEEDVEDNNSEEEEQAFASPLVEMSYVSDEHSIQPQIATSKTKTSRKQLLSRLIGQSSNTLSLETSPIKSNTQLAEANQGELEKTPTLINEVRQTKSGRVIRYTPYFKELLHGVTPTTSLPPTIPTEQQPPPSKSKSKRSTKKKTQVSTQEQQNLEDDLDAINMAIKSEAANDIDFEINEQEDEEPDEEFGEDDDEIPNESDDDSYIEDGPNEDDQLMLSIPKDNLDGFSLWSIKYRQRHSHESVDNQTLCRSWKKMSLHDRKRWCLKAEAENHHFQKVVIKHELPHQQKSPKKSSKRQQPQSQTETTTPILLQKTLNQYAKQIHPQTTPLENLQTTKSSKTAIRPPNAFARQHQQQQQQQQHVKTYDVVDIAAGIYLLGESLTKMSEKVRQLGHLNPRATSVENLSTILFDGTLCACNLMACLGNEIVQSSTESKQITSKLMENVGIILPGLG
ncbi:unnamed protein product [Didymodactylos carnosus]|uniref:Uncharacterized protein n=1 Tax=Didymodactylos carnosus TaxID=1234261 RepID=A0A813NG19_9BILA|nr:unnamed protein product [Didymodactylos carnosus]CAF1071246.1 unnamed protein product [Didymodactylos carnosus]CAF3515665.1 unnamed protein product [Didymodactylos carnosus]CAF3835562.1 unnamed protein product [Didymodactylos carnosus]